jgi:pilus assembly protein CpaF
MFVSSLNEPVIKENITMHDKKINFHDFTKDISNELVEKYAALISDVQAGIVSRIELEKRIAMIIDNKKVAFANRNEILSSVYDYMFGYGILQQYVENEEISDIDFLGRDYMTIKRNGIKEHVPLSFSTNKEFEDFCKLLIIRNGGIINENISHERVSDPKLRLRINVTIPPRSWTGASLHIRKHRLNPYTLEQLRELNMLDDKSYKELVDSFAAGKKIVFVGAGGSGKTTLLRALLQRSNPLDIYLVAEKDVELYLDSLKNFTSHKIKKLSEGGLPVTLEDLVRDGLTMSLYAYVVGEMVGSEALEFLKAGYTGHKVYGTMHASSAANVPVRFMTLIDGTTISRVSEKTINRLIAGSIDLIVHMEKFKVKEIVSLNGYDEQEGKIIMNTVYQY